MENLVILASALAAEVATIAVSNTHINKKATNTMSYFEFDATLDDASCTSWLLNNLRYSKQTLLTTARFLRLDGVAFASNGFKKHSYNKKEVVSLYVLASPGGYWETVGTFAMNKSDVAEIVDEITQAGTLITEDSQATELVGSVDGPLLVVDQPDYYEELSCRKGYPATNTQAIVTAE
ncbi:hypothetical protein ON010_g8450 [Phytophthora cinnamomi]|nr:hypothetical protein ON010_g8450 [Phytophthora cinnamomi]